MPRTSSLALAAVLLVSGSTLAVAQSSRPCDQGRRYAYDDGYGDWSNQGPGQYRSPGDGRYGAGQRGWSGDDRSADDRRFDEGQYRFRYGSNDDRWRQGEQDRWRGAQYGRSAPDYGYEGSRRNTGSYDVGTDQGAGRQGSERRRFGANEGTAGSAASSSFDQQGAVRALRRELRQYGLQDIKILDTSYLVQARLPSGRTVLLIADPPNASLRVKADALGANQNGTQADQARTAQSGDRMGAQSSSGATARNGSDESVLDGVTAKQVRSTLEARGFSDIQNLHKDGSAYVGQADWYGDQVDFRFDGRNGYVIEPNHMTSDQVQTMLDDEGWTNVRILQKGEKSYKLRGTKNGVNYQMRVDAETGEVYRQAAMDSPNASDDQTGSIQPGDSAANGEQQHTATSGSASSGSSQSYK